MSNTPLRVLIIEDEPDLALTLSYNLEQAGYEVAAELTGGGGLVRAETFLPDLILLDLMLPDSSGFEVCRALKESEATRDAPVVMLTARGEEVDRVKGFEVGAEDYVLKPFSVKELLLRLKVITRRRHQAEELPQSQLSFGPIKIDRESHQVWVEGAEVALTLLELNLLTTLIERRGKTQSRAQLLTDVWETSAELTTRTVDTHVKRLRDKLGAAGELIQTVRGVGYRFKQSLER